MCGVKGDSFTDFVSQTARLGVFKFNKNMKIILNDLNELNAEIEFELCEDFKGGINIISIDKNGIRNVNVVSIKLLENALKVLNVYGNNKIKTGR